MTDLHTHILPQIDDGAKDVKMSLQLLAAQQRVGVSQIVCTPHFHFERQNLDDFVQKRYESAKKLAKTLSAYPNFRIGIFWHLWHSASVYAILKAARQTEKVLFAK